MRLPTGAIDQTFNLIHKGCGIVLMVLAIAFGFSAHHRIFGKDGTAEKFSQTMDHLNQSADATHNLIADESQRQKALYDKLGSAVDSAGGTIRQANTTIEKLGTAIRVTQQNLTTTTGAVNGTLGEVQSTLAAVRGDAETANTAIAGIRPVLDQSTIDLASLDALIKDPSIKQSLQNLSDSSGNITKVTASTAKIAETIAVKVDALAHPTRTRRIVDGLITVARTLGSLGWLVK